MTINKSQVTDDGTNIYVDNDFISTLVSGSETISVAPERQPSKVLSQSPDIDIIGTLPIDKVELEQLDTPIDISFNQIDFYTPDGTYLPSLEVIINTLVEGAEEYVINYTKIS